MVRTCKKISNTSFFAEWMLMGFYWSFAYAWNWTIHLQMNKVAVDKAARARFARRCKRVVRRDATRLRRAWNLRAICADYVAAHNNTASAQDEDRDGSAFSSAFSSTRRISTRNNLRRRARRDRDGHSYLLLVEHSAGSPRDLKPATFSHPLFSDEVTIRVSNVKTNDTN